MDIETVKGFRDYTGEEALKRAKIKKILEKNFRLYGFEPAETPVIENREFVIGEETNQEKQDEAISDIFKLEDKGKRKLALRYEFTFQLKRIAKNQKLPYKRYQIGPVFRDEPVSANRLRQFTQCDVDIIGSTINDEAEILALTKKVLDELGIEFVIYINNRKLLDEILDELKVNKDSRTKVIRIIDKLDKKTESEIKEELKKYKAEKVIEVFKKPESYFKKYKAYQEIQELKDFCKIYGLDKEIKFSVSLARGFSYYNGSVFEVKTTGKNQIKETITGGGSYSVSCGGTKAQSTGISFGLERLSSLANISIEDLKPKAIVLSMNKDEEAIKIVEMLRQNNIPCIFMSGKISKALAYANLKQIPYMIIVGDKLELKDMKTGKQKIVSEKDLMKL